MKVIYSLLIAMLVLSLNSCKNSKNGRGLGGLPENPQENEWYLNASAFQDSINGKVTNLYRLSNESGMEVYVTNYGAVIPAILVPDRDGKQGDIVLGFDSLSPYIGRDPNFGAVVGRYGNRIGGAKFELNGQVYELAMNDRRGNNLHGGPIGFSEKVYDIEELTENSITLKLISPDGDMGFPGTLSVIVSYTVTADNSLEAVYQANTDAPTVLNLTQHSYFNLSGEGNGDILDHELMLNADRYTPVNEQMIPTGDIATVSETPLDFTIPTKIGLRIEDDFEQLEFGNGYDHNFIIKGEEGELNLAATAYCEETGRLLEVFTTEPGVQLYTGNWLNGSLTGKTGSNYEKRSGFCLETQRYPDTPNKPDFPSAVLNPGEEYHHKAVFKFSLK